MINRYFVFGVNKSYNLLCGKVDTGFNSIRKYAKTALRCFSRFSKKFLTIKFF